jgi:DNA-binding protein YbaB
MLMINPLKLLKMKQEADQMRKKLQSQRVTGESKDGRVKIFMNLAQEFEDIFVDEEILSDARSLELIKRGMKEAFQDYQKKLQKEMIKDFDIDQLKRMLG